ncbi:hypothetical protein THASP1DRAFT_30808, partial [Thamnocephalis sphaerospora]
MWLKRTSTLLGRVQYGHVLTRQLTGASGLQPQTKTVPLQTTASEPQYHALTRRPVTAWLHASDHDGLRVISRKRLCHRHNNKATKDADTCAAAVEAGATAKNKPMYIKAGFVVNNQSSRKKWTAEEMVTLIRAVSSEDPEHIGDQTHRERDDFAISEMMARAVKDLNHRSPYACLMQYYFLRNAARHLQQLADSKGADFDVAKEVADANLPNISIEMILALKEAGHLLEALPGSRDKRESHRWSEVDRLALLDVVNVHDITWNSLSLMAARVGRSPFACLLHLRFLRDNMSIRQGQWLPDEKERLQDAVERYGRSNWREVATEVGTRNVRQCWTHWHNVMNARRSNRYWTPEEDAQLTAA